MGLFGKKNSLEVSLSVSPEVVLPGDTFIVTVTLAGDPDPQLESPSLLLEAPVAVSFDDAHVGSFGEIDPDQDVTHHREIFAGPTEPGEHRYSLTIPADAVPFAAMAASRASYWRVVYSGRGRRYYYAEVPVRVCRPDVPGPGRDDIPPRVLETSDAASIEVWVPRRLRSGVTVTGTVRVQAHRDVELKAIELQLASSLVRRFTSEPLPLEPLQRHDDVPHGARSRVIDRFTKRVDVPVQRLAAGQVVDVPIEYRIPNDDWPTYTSGLTRTHWTLRVSADLAGAKDPELELELDVHNA